MLRSVQIEGFRGFKSFALHDLGRVNLLVGANNSGKTSLLEAIELLVSGNFGTLAMAMWRRGERLARRTGEPLLDLRRIFPGFILGSGVRCALCGVAAESVTEVELELQSIQGQGRFQHEMELRISAESPASREAITLPLLGAGGLLFRPDRAIVEGFARTEFLPTSSLTPGQIHERVEAIAFRPEEEMVLKVLRLIEPGIEGFRTQGGVLGELYSSGPVFGREGIIVKLAGHAEPVPIGSFGEGVYRLLGLALALVSARGGALLVDEIDTGLHYTVMDKMWRMVKDAAERLDVQVFATTHSRDCFQSLATIVDPVVTGDSQVTIQRIEPGSDRSVAFNEQEIALAAERGYEVR